MIMAWDLGMPMKRRSYRYGAFAQSGTRRLGRWEKLTRDEEDDSLYEEDDDEEDFLTSDGDVLGDVLESGGRRGSRYRAKQDDIPFEQRWELDTSRVEPGQVRYINNFYLRNLFNEPYSESSLEAIYTSSYRLG